MDSVSAKQYDIGPVRNAVIVLDLIVLPLQKKMHNDTRKRGIGKTCVGDMRTHAGNMRVCARPSLDEINLTKLSSGDLVGIRITWPGHPFNVGLWN